MFCCISYRTDTDIPDLIISKTTYFFPLFSGACSATMKKKKKKKKKQRWKWSKIYNKWSINAAPTCATAGSSCHKQAVHEWVRVIPTNETLMELPGPNPPHCSQLTKPHDRLDIHQNVQSSSHIPHRSGIIIWQRDKSLILLHSNKRVAVNVILHQFTHTMEGGPKPQPAHVTINVTSSQNCNIENI